jgi:FAD-dependent oxidoreductase domain-containing protein 1
LAPHGVREDLSENFDVVILGGAAMGSSLAYHLAADSGFSGKILVVERDLTYAGAASALSLSSIRRQFSSPVNIRIAAASFAFLQEAGERLEVDGERAELPFVSRGYLYLASESGVATLRENHAVQIAEGSEVALLTPEALTRRYPGMSSEGVALASLGLAGEGWFDGYALTQAFRRKAKSLGAVYRQAEAVDFTMSDGGIAAVRLANGETINAGVVVIAAGASGATKLAAKAGVALPVSSRKRCVFVFETPGKIADCPLVIDPSGVYFRPEGEVYLAGTSPDEAHDVERFDYDVDWPLFDDVIWPALAVRVPGFERLKVRRAWAGHYDLNVFDANAIVGKLGALRNTFVAAGFSGHGMQQSPTIGRGLAEMIASGRFATLDLSQLSFERIAANRPLLEKNVI